MSDYVLEGFSWRPYGRKEPVLRDLTFDIAAGERVLLVGPSGSGKSTLLRALAGVLASGDAGEASGSLTLGGRAPGARPGEVGLVLQEPGAGVVAATVERDVAFGLENIRCARNEMPELIASALARVGLADLPRDTPTSALSGGQTQRLALAGALALSPSVLMLDEPTAMLDADNAASVRQAVADVLASGDMTLVVVEHVLGPWVPLVDRLIVLSDEGRVLADGPVAQVLDEQGDQLTEAGLWVPGAPTPTPLPVDPDLIQVEQPSGALAPQAPLEVTGPLVIERTTRLSDGTARTRVAAELTQPLCGDRGTLTALTGASGSGKSTLLQAFAGFLAPAAGSVTVNGEDPVRHTSTGLARNLAWVPQWSSATLVAPTVLDEVLATSKALGKDDEQTQRRALELLRAVGLEHLAPVDPRELSGGEQRRLSLAAAILHGPAVLLADEPTVGQDRHTWAALVGLTAAYRRAGGVVVTATHDAEVIARADAVHEVRAPQLPPAGGSAAQPLASKAGPLALLIGAFLGVPAGVLSTRWQDTLLVIATQLVLTAVALLPGGRATWRRLALRLAPGLLASLSVGWSTWFLAGHDLDAALTVALRVIAIVIPSAALIPLINPDALGDHLAQRLRLPARPVVAVTAALQRVQGFGDQWTESSRARRVRGLAATWRTPVALIRQLFAMTFGLLVRTLRAAAVLAVAMDSRGFASAFSRTWAHPAPWRIADSLLVLLAAIPAVLAALS